MRSLLLIFSILSSPAIAQVTLEDWACYQVTNATSAGAGKSNLTCNAPHGWGAPGAVVYLNIEGATGTWSQINNQSWLNSNPMSIGATDTKIQMNDTRWLMVPSMIQIDSEDIWVTSKDSNYIYIGPGGGCSTGRGCSSTTPASHAPQAGATYNLAQRVTWAGTIIDASTVQISLNSSSFGSFSGQTVYVRRTVGSNVAGPLGAVYNGQPWASYDDVTANGLVITVPGCSSTTDAFLCQKGFLTPYSGKGYSYTPGGIAISSFTVSGTPPNQIAKIAFASPYTQVPPSASLTPINTAVNGLGALVYVDGVDESGTGLNTLNRPYLVQSVTGSGGKVTQVTLAISGVPNGTYTAAASSKFSCSTRPCLIIPWPGDPYSDYNINPGGSVDRYPGATIPQFIKNGGSWSTSTNRYRILIKHSGVTRPVPSNGNGTMDLGTYFWFGTQVDDKAHGYHTVGYPIVDGAWVQLEFNAAFDHIVGASAPYYYANDAMLAGGWIDAPSWRGGARHYYDAMERQYWDWSLTDPTIAPLTGSTLTIKKIDLYTAASEPEEYVQTRSILYDGAKYQLGWTGPRQDFTSLPVAYNVVYSASDLKTAGWSSGTPGGSASNSAGGTGGGVLYSSPSMAQASTIYFGIRPIAQVLAVSRNGASPIWLWSYVDYGLSAGDHITTSNVGGSGNVTNAAVSSVQARQMWYRFAPDSNQPWTNQGTLTSISSDASHNCTVTLNGVNHNLVVGWPIIVTNPPDNNLFGSGANNKTFYVTSTPTTSTFVFGCPNATPNTTWNTDYDATYHFGVASVPGVAVPGTGSGIAPTSPTMMATDDKKNFAEIAFSPPSSSCSITSSYLPHGLVGSAYAQTLQTASCVGPLTWSVTSGSLCAGLTLVAGSGAITGAPTTAQTCSVTVQVTDSAYHTASQSLSIMVTSPCDINGDGVVDSTDVALSLSMVLGQTACTADLDQDGRCTVVDLQRVTDAVNGVCRVGQ